MTLFRAFREGVFTNGESHACHLSPPQTSCQVALPLARHLGADLRISILMSSTLWHDDQEEDQEDHLRIIDTVLPLPTFALIRWIVPATAAGLHAHKSNYLVRVRLHERIQRVIETIFSQQSD